MSDFSTRLAILLSLDSKGAIREIQQVGTVAERDLGRAEQSTVRLANRFLATGGIMVGAAAAMGYGLYQLAQQSVQADQSQLRLENTLARSPKLAGENKQAFLDLADAIQSKTAADGDEVVAAEAMLGTFHLTGEEIRKATPLVVDYARKFGVDLTSAAIQVGKAFDGNVGTLQRNGVKIDETAYKTDRYGAVITALRENAGGFAEAEGRTFQGRLESLQNRLGDVAEGVGSGVVSALDDLMAAAEPATDAIAGIDDATGGAVGQIATFGTVGVGAAGGLMVLAGSGLRMYESFQKLEAKLPVVATGIKGLAIAGGVVGAMAGLVAIGDELGLVSHGLEYDLRTLQGAMRESGPATRLYADGFFNMAELTGEASDAIQKLAAESPSTAQAIIDASSKTGKERAELTKIVEHETAITRQAADATRSDASETQGLVQAKEEEVAARNAAVDAQIAEFDSKARMQQAERDLNDAMSEHQMLQQAAIEAGGRDAVANDALTDSAAKLADQIRETAAAHAKHAEDVAKAHGATDAAALGTAAYRAELGRIAMSMAPDSPIRANLLSMIRDLDNAAKPRTGSVDLDTSPAHRALDQLQGRLAREFSNIGVTIATRLTGPYGGP